MAALRKQLMKFCILAAMTLQTNEMRRTTSNGFLGRIVGDARSGRKLVFCDHTYFLAMHITLLMLDHNILVVSVLHSFDL